MQPGYPPGSQPGYPPGFQPGYPPKKSGGGGAVMIVLVVVGVLGVGCIGLAVLGAALLMPAMTKVREAAGQAQNRLDLQQIGLALHNYHDVYATLPPAYIPDAEGKPRTSWRALLLPYVDQGGLNYNYNVAWNAPENSAATQVGVGAYLDAPTEQSGGLKTSYLAITGPGTAFNGAEAVSFSRVPDGLSNTIFIVQVKNSNVDWAEPRDLDINSLSTDPSAPNFIDLQNGALAVQGDGAVITLRGITLEALKDYFTIADGKALPPLF